VVAQAHGTLSGEATLVLDTIARGIPWLWPISDAEFMFVTVEAR
jgi:hypothetical protein